MVREGLGELWRRFRKQHTVSRASPCVQLPTTTCLKLHRSDLAVEKRLNRAFLHIEAQRFFKLREGQDSGATQTTKRPKTASSGVGCP